MRRSHLTLVFLCLILPALCLWSAGSRAEEPQDCAAAVQPAAPGRTAQLTVRVRTFIDGDTAHFDAPDGPSPDGVFRARFLACNTPEFTGRIEEYGRAAARFTREKLGTAEEIRLESDTSVWERDSGGDRYLVWVWYRPAGETRFRNLNIELLQNGLAIAYASAQNRYGETCMAAIRQAQAQKLRVWSGQPDPDFYYGDAIELTIRELRFYPERYEGKKVAFTGVITMIHDNAAYLESFDPETGLYYGISAYYGRNMSAGGLAVFHAGNEARIVGTLQYYEAGQTWQIAGMTYRMMKPDDPGNIRKLSDGHEPAWVPTDPEAFFEDITVQTDGGSETRPFAALALDTSVSMTVNADVADSAIPGLLCLECGDCGPDSVLVYTPFDTDAAGEPLTAENIGRRILSVRGLVHRYGGTYCIRVYTRDGIAFLD